MYFFIKICGFSLTILLVLILLIFTSDDRIIKIRKWEDATGPHLYALDFIGLVAKHGRRAEEYTVITEDGYILLLFRIPPSPKSAKHQGIPVFIQHPFLCTADTFLLRDAKSNLPIILSDTGYDVWIGNVRGNTYGRRHLKLSPNDYKFWDFSLDDYATQDLRANLDFVLQSTNSSSVSVIAMSMGTIITKILLSERPEYNDKIDLFINLASVAYFKSSNSMTRFLHYFWAAPYYGLPRDWTIEIFALNDKSYLFIKYFCLMNDYFKRYCIQLHNIIVGDSHEQSLWPNETLDAALHLPAGTSTKVFNHFFQFITTIEFKAYDYEDEALNTQHYGQPTPPFYNISNINVPMVIFHGQNDPFSTMENDDCFISQLADRKIVSYEVVNFTGFNHIDFIVARDVRTLVYDRILVILEDFRSSKEF